MRKMETSVGDGMETVVRFQSCSSPLFVHSIPLPPVFSLLSPGSYSPFPFVLVLSFVFVRLSSDPFSHSRSVVQLSRPSFPISSVSLLLARHAVSQGFGDMVHAFGFQQRVGSLTMGLSVLFLSRSFSLCPAPTVDSL